MEDGMIVPQQQTIMLFCWIGHYIYVLLLLLLLHCEICIEISLRWIMDCLTVSLYEPVSWDIGQLFASFLQPSVFAFVEFLTLLFVVCLCNLSSSTHSFSVYVWWGWRMLESVNQRKIFTCSVSVLPRLVYININIIVSAFHLIMSPVGLILSLQTSLSFMFTSQVFRKLNVCLW